MSGGQLTYQTSCRCPATRAAGLKGSSRRVVADMARRGVNVAGFFSTLPGLDARRARVGVIREARVARAIISKGDAREKWRKPP